MNSKMYDLYHKSQALRLEADCGDALAHYFMAVPCGAAYVIHDAIKHVMKATKGRVSADYVAKMFRGVIE